MFLLRVKSNYGLSRTFLSTNTYFHLRMLPENWYSLLFGQRKKLHVHRFGRGRAILRPFRTPAMIRMAASGYINMFPCQNSGPGTYVALGDTFLVCTHPTCKKWTQRAKNEIDGKSRKNRNFLNFIFGCKLIFIRFYDIKSA